MTEIERLTELVAHLEGTKAEAEKQVETALARCRDRIPAAAAAWIRIEMDRVAAAQRARIAELGESGVAKVKAERDAAIGQVPKLTADAFSRDYLGAEWPHRAQSRYGAATHRTVEGVFRQVVSNALLPILRAHGLGNAPWWALGPSGPNRETGYTGQLDLPSDVSSAAADYENLSERYWDEREKLDRARRELAEARGANLWGS